MRKLIRAVFLILVIAVPAQQAAAQSKTMVVHPYDPASDTYVSLLGETGSALRHADSGAPPCVGVSTAVANSSRATFGSEQALVASITLPAGWTASPIPTLPGGAVATGTRMVARMAAPSVDGDMHPTQAFVFVGPEEGFPRVVPVKDSKIGSPGECRTTLTTSQTASLIRAEAVLPDGAKLTYVMGYAKLSGDVWISYLASSAAPADVALLTTLFRSIQVSAAK